METVPEIVFNEFSNPISAPHIIYVTDYNIYNVFVSSYNYSIIRTRRYFIVEKLIVSKKPLKGEDGYKVFSVRIKDETVDELDRISKESNRSRNEIINIFLDFAIKNCEIK